MCGTTSKQKPTTWKTSTHPNFLFWFSLFLLPFFTKRKIKTARKLSAGILTIRAWVSTFRYCLCVCVRLHVTIAVRFEFAQWAKFFRNHKIRIDASHLNSGENIARILIQTFYLNACTYQSVLSTYFTPTKTKQNKHKKTQRLKILDIFFCFPQMMINLDFSLLPDDFYIKACVLDYTFSLKYIFFLWKFVWCEREGNFSHLLSTKRKRGEKGNS